MKKLLLVVAALALVVWVASWFWNPQAAATAVARSWPGGLGTFESLDRRFPSVQGNASAARLMTLFGALPKNDAVDEFVWREMTSAELAIGEPPAALPDIAPIRDVLLREPIVWERNTHTAPGDESAPRAMYLQAARSLAASALARARTNDAAAWDDLHAVWNLARSLESQPQMTLRTAVLAMARMTNAVAWKMPLPVPDWFAELQARDMVLPLVEGFQHQTAAYWNDYSRVPTKVLADSVEQHRRIAGEVLRSTQCDVNPPVNPWGPDLTSVWRRGLRYRAEREATANALRMREGKPIETKSACSDGSWSAEGTTLRFSKALDPRDARDRPMPLVLHVAGAGSTAR